MDVNVFSTRSQLEEAAAYLRERIQYSPTVGIILGSGLGSFADDIERADVFLHTSIPHFPSPTVPGHAGRVIIATLEGQPVLIMQGRVHFYEGYTMQQVTFPVRVMRLLGIDTLIVTNAAGGLDSDWTPGDLMLISDHINLVGIAGRNPLTGHNDPGFGPRFPDMSQAYDLTLRESARRIAQAEQIPLREGVYACLAGPSFETPAEIRFLRIIGADAVGMSTAPEVIAARHMGMRVLGISGISNVHSTDASQPQETSHSEVLEAGEIIAPRLTALVRGVLKKL